MARPRDTQRYAKSGRTGQSEWSRWDRSVSRNHRQGEALGPRRRGARVREMPETSRGTQDPARRVGSRVASGTTETAETKRQGEEFLRGERHEEPGTATRDCVDREGLRPHEERDRQRWRHQYQR